MPLNKNSTCSVDGHYRFFSDCTFNFKIVPPNCSYATKVSETTFLLTFNNTPGVSIVLQSLNVTARARGILEHAHLTTPLASKIRLARPVVNSVNLYLTA